jgi:hypothetical protein
MPRSVFSDYLGDLQQMTKLEQRCRELVKRWRGYAKKDYRCSSVVKERAEKDRLATSAAAFSWCAEELDEQLLAQRKPKAKRKAKSK